SEFLTFGEQAFSTSRGNVVGVREVLDLYGPDGIRYYICAAGPESQDSSFTWHDFVQRNNSELVAGWGNLVSRTAAMVAKSFGEIPAPADLQPVDDELRATVTGAFETVGALLRRNRVKAALAEVMRVVGEVNAYVSRTEPFKLKGEDERERLGTVLHTLVQSVSDLNTLFAPFIPHAANRVHEALGGDAQFVPMPELRPVGGLDPADADQTYPVITGDYSRTPRWESSPVTIGTPIVKPAPLFAKLDEAEVLAEWGLA